MIHANWELWYYIASLSITISTARHGPNSLVWTHRPPWLWGHIKNRGLGNAAQQSHSSAWATKKRPRHDRDTPHHIELTKHIEPKKDPFVLCSIWCKGAVCVRNFNDECSVLPQRSQSSRSEALRWFEVGEQWLDELSTSSSSSLFLRRRSAQLPSSHSALLHGRILHAALNAAQN